MTTFAKFANQSDIDNALLLAVINQIGSWEKFQECADNVIKYKVCGTPGFSHYGESIRFAQTNIDLIKELGQSIADKQRMRDNWTVFASLYHLHEDFDGDEIADIVNRPQSKEYSSVMYALSYFALREAALDYSAYILNLKAPKAEAKEALSV